eukprot:TRINITY_DN9231_c0_g2_i28.p1 TRINITY_DN9231_c0_g2~~TRINITY_DN9231_c0_g2_i28.p1  ORF type:complete len:236 (+),score=34.88 TRINITY_DN9231_c0_g2_i28:176-883(+)
MERARRRGTRFTRTKKRGSHGTLEHRPKKSRKAPSCDTPLKLMEGKPCHTAIIKRSTNTFIIGSQIEDQVHYESIDAFCLMGIKRAIPAVFKVAKRFAYAHKDWWFRVNYYSDVPPELGPPAKEVWVAVVVTAGEIPDADSAETFIGSMYTQDGKKAKSDANKTGKTKGVSGKRENLELEETKDKESVSGIEETDTHSIENEKDADKKEKLLKNKEYKEASENDTKSPSVTPSLP